MPDAFGLDSDVFFGDPDQPLPDWRKDAEATADADDEENAKQPGVAAMLGFDPSEIGDDEGGGAKGFDRLAKAAASLWNGESEGKDYP